MNSSFKKLVLLILIVLPLTDCTSPMQGGDPQEGHRYFATGFVREHDFWLCGNSGLMLEHCDCAECPGFKNDLLPLNRNPITMAYKDKYVGVEGFWLEDTLGLCPMIVVESVREIPIRYRCGDVNHDWLIDSIDAILIADYSFSGCHSELYLEQADTNCDGIANISDAVYVINYINLHDRPPCDWNRDGIPDC